MMFYVSCQHQCMIGNAAAICRNTFFKPPKHPKQKQLNIYNLPAEQNVPFHPPAHLANPKPSSHQ